MYHLSKDAIDKILKHIVIVVDTAEKEAKNDHILDWFDAKKHKYTKKKLPYGDYTGYIEHNEETEKLMGITRNLWFDNLIAIERKANLTELAGNLKQNDKTHERQRIESEFMKAKLNGCYLPMFVEDPNGIINIFKRQYGKFQNGQYITSFEPKSFYMSIKGFEARYKYTTAWYSKEQMGHEIYNTIRMHIREWLKTY